MQGVKLGKICCAWERACFGDISPLRPILQSPWCFGHLLDFNSNRVLKNGPFWIIYFHLFFKIQGGPTASASNAYIAIPGAISDLYSGEYLSAKTTAQTADGTVIGKNITCWKKILNQCFSLATGNRFIIEFHSMSTTSSTSDGYDCKSKFFGQIERNLISDFLISVTWRQVPCNQAVSGDY